MSSILYDLINNKAVNTYTGPIPTSDNYNVWAAHWFRSAEDLARDFENQSLPETANAVRIIIEQNKRFSNYETQSSSSAPSTR